MNFSFFADFLFPHICLACKAKTRDAWCCATCFDSITRNPATTGAEFHAASNYSDPVVQKLIRELKFNFMQPAAIPLGDIIADYALQYARIFPSLRDAIIIPIPLSKKRERERGFNQSLLIAKQFGKIFGADVRDDILVRVHNKKPQSETENAAERKQNIIGVFAVRRKPPEKIILVDDVVTTGSTFREASRVLLESGVHSLVPIAAARS